MRTERITLGKNITLDLPVVPLPTLPLSIIVFDSLGKMQMIKDIAKLATESFTKPDYIVTPEAKSIPLAQEMARLWDIEYFVLRKAQKLYMKTAKSLTVQSITTAAEQKLWYDAEDIGPLKNKKVMLFDDVISTGGTLGAMLDFAEENKLQLSSIAAIFREGDSLNIDELKEKYGKVEFLGYLPLLPS